VLTEEDPYFCLDIDGCLQADKTWSPEALAVVAAFPGAMVEVSMSGNGLHIWGRYTPPIPTHACKNVRLGLELYHTRRFIALGQPGATGSPDIDCTNALAAAIFTWFPPSIGGDSPEEWTTEGEGGIDDDDALVERALRSGGAKAAFGTRATFRDLWEANEIALERTYPSQTGQPFDASSADMALAAHLAFWTGKNCERVKSLMFKSALKRDKWDREAYIDSTVMRAVSRCKETFTPAAEGLAAELAAEGLAAEGLAVSGGWPPKLTKGPIWADVQAELFAGCVYVIDVHRVLVPGGKLLSPDQFNTVLGGHSFQTTKDNSKMVRKAWEAFTDNELFDAPQAGTSCFRPDLAPGTIVDGEVNIYWPALVKRASGNPRPFLDHAVKVLPVARDREILFAYMAAVVQHPGVKFPWAPFIQGAPGNGKTLFSLCVAYAVGERYTHWPNASELTGKFNSWRYGNIFAAVEDIYVSEKREDVAEAMKPLITATRVSIEGKGKDQVSRWVCGNFIFNSNRKDGLRKMRMDRRYAPFFTAQQEEGDLDASGMGGHYFSNLYGWLEKEGGYGIVAEYLASYPIPDELNPAMFCNIAPVTSSTEEAIEQGRGSVEQELVESIDQGIPGFCGGWVSSEAFHGLLERLKATDAIPRNRYSHVLRQLGYIRHPGAPGGRVAASTSGGPRPILYIKKDHWASNLTGTGEVGRAFLTAQASNPAVQLVPRGMFGTAQ